LIRDWDACIKKDEGFRDLVYQKNTIELLPPTDDRNMVMLEVHSGRAGGVIDHANGLLMAMPEFHNDPISQATEDKREAEAAELVFAALFEQQLLGNDFWNFLGRDLLIYSRSFIKTLLIESVWTMQEGWPVRQQKESGKDYLKKVRKFQETEAKFPLVIQHVPAMNILVHLDENDQVLASIEEKLVTARVLADELDSAEVREELSRRTLKWYDELTVIEYIDSEYIAYFLADTTPIDKAQDRRPHERVRSYKPLRIWKHGLGLHPVVMFTGTRTEMDNYEDRFKGFLSDAKDALELYDFLLSRLASMVYAYYLPSYIWHVPADTKQFKGRKRPRMKVNIGGVTVIFGDETLETLSIPQGLPDATMLIGQVDDIIQRHTIEDVLFGRVQGSAPAFQVNLRINVAKSKLTPFAQHMAQGLTNVIKRFCRSIEYLGEAVRVDGELMTVRMAKEYRNRITVQIEPKSPIDRNQDMGAAAMALDLGLPEDWVWEQILNIENPAMLRLERDILELEKLPPAKERLMMDALEALEILVDDDEMEDAEGIDLESLTPEAAEALGALLGGEQPLAEVELPPLLGGEEDDTAGFGPAPEGGAPQSLAPRGLTTPNEQPSPGDVEIASKFLGGRG
jgi:hypothetical protein